MKIVFDRSFEKWLKLISDRTLLERIDESIISIEQTSDLFRLASVKKLKGYKTYFRIRIGDYRLGFELEQDGVVRIILIAHRKEIYKYFP